MSDLLVKLDPVGSSEPANEFDVRFKGDRPVRIRTVLVSAFWSLGNIDVRYDDSARDPGPFLQPGAQYTSTFDIPEGDHLVALHVAHGGQTAGYPTNEVIQVRLETAKGVVSPVYGGGSGSPQIINRYSIRVREGHHIVGFHGGKAIGKSGGHANIPVRIGVYSAPIVLPDPKPVEPDPKPAEPDPKPIVDPKPAEPLADDGAIWVSPVLNVSDVPTSIRWFEALGWKRLSTMNAGGLMAGAADSNDAGPAFFAAIRAGYGQLFLYQNGQGLRDGKPAAPGSGDDVGATWQVWWLKTRAGVDAIHQRAVAAGVTIIAPPEDKPWGEVEMRIAHPEGHVFRVSAPIAAPQPQVLPPKQPDPQPEAKQPDPQPEEKDPWPLPTEVKPGLHLIAGKQFTAEGNDVTWISVTEDRSVFKVAPGGTAPVLVEGALNGQPALRFSGTAAVAGPAPMGPGTGTIVMVIEQKSKLRDKTQWAAGGASVETPYSDSSGENSFSDNSFVNWRPNVRDPSGVVYGKWHVLVWVEDGTTCKLYNNGVLKATYTGGAAPQWGQTLTIGNSASVQAGFSPDGHIAEVLVYPKALDDATRKGVETALLGKYALPPGTEGGAPPPPSNPLIGPDGFPVPIGTYDAMCGTFRGVLQINGTGPDNLSGTLDFSPYYPKMSPERIINVRWDAQTHLLIFDRDRPGYQTYHLTFADQGRTYTGRFLNHEFGAWGTASGTRR